MNKPALKLRFAVRQNEAKIISWTKNVGGVHLAGRSYKLKKV